jgi:hypothetical protein
LVVATRHSAASVPPAAAAGCIVADSADDMAQAIVVAQHDVDDRHPRERAGIGVVPTWPSVLAPVVDAVERLVRS